MPYCGKQFIKEQGLGPLCNTGYLMLRKLTGGAPILTKEEKSIKLSDGLLQFHQGQAMNLWPPVPSNFNATEEKDEISIHKSEAPDGIFYGSGSETSKWVSEVYIYSV
eukprot:scaffold2246_cov162-Amphora_coffeaeformis.AAC.4